MRTVEEIVKELQDTVQQYLDDETEMRCASWNYEEGILLSGEDVTTLLKVLSPEWSPKYPNYPPLVGYKEGYMDPFDIEVGMTVTYDDGTD